MPVEVSHPLSLEMRPTFFLNGCASCVDYTGKEAMAEELSALIIRVNDESFYHANYIVKPRLRLQKILDVYLDNLCTLCTDWSLLEF